ncbi:hypothetical protein DB35_15160 [Streptomyces abyssalis]|uniref:Uncharacterized protein n=1 Tax=Streptomyces abyssalis TaxID=933944 RepID=A0A1E7JFZ7_9ACTN|nr:hypothetical protein [Streptomyces abyssalis]OEU85393.1 hypothetical protein AN215_22850 [Streptomyces abyssalis]OEU93144.1 hypothetical protein DB35_15160 [Streptomyces abyssalis]
MMLKAARAALFAVLPAELLTAVLLVSGVPLPAPLLVVAELAVISVLLLEGVTVCRLFKAGIRAGEDRRTALRGAFRYLVPARVRRLIAFEVLGMASLVLWVARRRDGVPRGAVAVPYSREQSPFLLLILFVTVLETVATEVLLRGLGAPAGLRVVVLVLDLYGTLAVLSVLAAGVTRPHVVSGAELRVRYGTFFDVRVPRRLVASVRISHNYNERGLVSVEGDRLAVAVSSRTNLLVELTEPVTVVRPMGREERVTSVRFFADAPENAFEALREPQRAAGLPQREE